MKITGIETFVVSNGFTPPRPWHFCAIRTDAGLTGYSEFGSDGITRGLVGLVQDLGQRLIGKDPTAVEKHYVDLYRVVRQAPYGATQQAIAGIELALWDLAGKALSVPVYKLMVGPDVGICLDINVNFKPSEAVRVGRALEPYDLFWLEIDNQDPHALAQLKSSVQAPICSGEQLQTIRQYRPYFELHAMDVVKVDVQWQGFSAAKKVADLAETYELNIAPHNYNGHLSTFQSLNLCAAVSNVRIMESDPEQTPYRDELFTALPEIASGHMKIPRAPGWGTELNEKAAQKYAWPG